MSVRRLHSLCRPALVCATLIATRADGQMAGTHQDQAHKDMRWTNTLFVLFDQLEYAPALDERAVNVDARAWYGGAYRRVWLLAQSEFATARRQGEAEVQALYGRLIDPFWDAVIGVRVDQHWGDAHRRRAQFAIGLIGLAPYRFELEPTVFVSDRGDVSARFEAAFQMPLTQRLIAEPEIEVNVALQAVPAFAVRRGVNDYEAGVRVRYEFRREFAPYVGWSWSRRTTGTAGSAGISGPAAESRFVAGVRLWR